MINNFRKINSHLYAGAAPKINDVRWLKNKGITKIVSLDYDAGRKIDRVAKLLGIQHIMLPIDIGKKSSLIIFLHNDITKLFDNNDITYVHCKWGRDRTGLAIALYRCKCENWSCGKAFKEAKKYGFGIGLDPMIIHLYKKIIKQACGCKDEDLSFAYDIVSNEREYPSSYNDYSLDAWQQGSWSPYEDYRVREFPYAETNSGFPEQYPSRVDYGLDDSDALSHENIEVPQVGQWDQNTQGISGAGPSMIGSGTII